MSKVKVDKGKKPAKQTYFNLRWLKDYEWVKQGDNKTLFGCKRCGKTNYKLNNMGERALKSHMKANAHIIKAEDVHEQVKKFSRSTLPPLLTPPKLKHLYLLQHQMFPLKMI